jgi:hypothetical protein
VSKIAALGTFDFEPAGVRNVEAGTTSASRWRSPQLDLL